MLQAQAGGRPRKGYGMAKRRQLWKKVRCFMLQQTGTTRTPRQLMHRWADILEREVDLLDFLGVEVERLDD